ncbi:MAG: ParB/RepB/Spo0J family partition protein [bacterium]|nr:ParB/RepB/Spo0J family partition protein [bacterium]
MSLGRGLGALITPTQGKPKRFFQSGAGSDGKDQLWQIPLSEIQPDPTQPRKHFQPEVLQELADSIKEHGILQPLLVSEKVDGGYLLIAGERRLRAAKLAGLATAPVLVKKLAEQARLEVSLIENIQRADLNPIEEAFAFRRLVDEFHLTQEEVGKKVGKSRPSISNTMRLLNLPDEIQLALVEGKINMGQARALLSLETREKQLSMMASMLGQKITVRDVERAINKDHHSSGIPTRRDANLVYLEDKLRAALGTKVIISKKGEQGSIAINFYSKDELGRLVKRLSD